MTKEEFKPIAKKLRLAYNRDGFLDGKEQINLWLCMLEDLDARRVDRAVTAYIHKGQFPPTIADIRAEYSKLKSEESVFKAQMMEIYGETKGVYPCSYDSPKTRAAWKQAVEFARKKLGCKTLDAAWAVKDVTTSIVSWYEQHDRVDKLPEWIDFLEGFAEWDMNRNKTS